MKKLNFGRTIVVGMGKSGMAAAELLKTQDARVTVYDGKQFTEAGEGHEIVDWAHENGFDNVFGTDPGDISVYDTLVLSPGVPPAISFAAEAASLGKDVMGELELAYRLADGRFIGITGTNGKTTTTTLVGEIMKNAGFDTKIVGNVGVPVTSEVPNTTEDTVLVTEISSFQLETIRDFKPVVSAILNITPDHLNRHGTFENYADAKGRIFENQDEKGYLVVNADDAPTMAQAGKAKAKVIPFSRTEKHVPGAFVADGIITVADEAGKEYPLCAASELIIPGAHNLENALAAAAITFFAGAGPEAIGETLRKFEGVEHRMEYCGTKNGVRFVNDSKGTNPDASIKAIQSVEGGIVLIAGGYDKGASFDEFIGEFKGRVKAMVLMGVTAPKIKAAAEAQNFKAIIDAENMKDAVEKAFAAAEPGNTVLLSPCCASWDMYKCFEDRGDDFRNCFNALEV